MAQTAECGSGPSKSTINIFEVAEVVENGKVSFGERRGVGSKKLKSFSR
jgi:hypothetical protein